LVCVFAARNNRLFLAIWLYYLVTLSPILGITQVGAQAMADRYTYLPGIGMTFLAAIGFGLIFKKFRGSGRGKVLMRYMLVAGIGVLAFVYSVITIKQISVWKNTETLWSRVIEVKPMQVGKAYYARGNYYALHGEPEKALYDMNISLNIAESKQYKSDYKIYFSRGNIYLNMGRYEEAIADYTTAIKHDLVARPEYYFQRARAFQSIGRAEEAKRDLEFAQSLIMKMVL
jgi:hypothetical protein